MYLTAFNVFKVPPFQALLTQYLWSNCLNQPLFQEVPSIVMHQRVPQVPKVPKNGTFCMVYLCLQVWC